MAKRKSKSGTKQQHEDTSLLWESSVSVPQSSGMNAYVLPALLFLILAVFGSMMGWYFTQQQYSLDQLSESYTALQTRITKFEQVMGWSDAQMDTALVVEERILALEEAQKQAQQTAEVALATSEKLRNTDLHSQIWAIRAEMEVRSTEMQQVAISTASLWDMFKNQSKEFEAVKEGIEAVMSSSSALAANVAGLTSAVARANSRVDEQVTLVEALNAHLEGQATELNKLKVSLDLHNTARYTNSQEVVAIKELVEAEQAVRALALEEKLSSVQRTLDEQFFTSQTLHSSIKAQLQNVHTQLVNGGQIASHHVEVKPNEEAPAAEELISAAEVQEELEHVEEDAEEAAEQQAEEEAVQEEQGVEREEREEPLEVEMTGESEEREVVTEDSEEGCDVEESLEEEESEDAEERDFVEEKPVELESEVLEEDE